MKLMKILAGSVVIVIGIPIFCISFLVSIIVDAVDSGYSVGKSFLTWVVS